MDEPKSHIICSRCGNKEERRAFSGYYEDRTRTILERYCGFQVNHDAYHNLCESCKEWYMYCAVEGILDQDQREYLKGEANGQEETPDV